MKINIFIYLSILSLHILQEVQINSFNYLTLGLKDSNTIQFTWRYTNNQNSWIAIGIGGYLMNKVDMHVIRWLNQAPYFYISDYWSEDYKMPIEDIFLGGVNNLNFESFVFNSKGDRILVYSRLLDTQDSFDNNINFGYNSLVSAWSPFDSSMTSHGTYVGVGSFYVNKGSFAITLQIGKYNIWEIHGFGLLFIWSIINSISYSIIRIYKHNENLVLLHKILGFSTALLSIILGFIGIFTFVNPPKVDYAFIQIHIVFGFIFMGLSVIMLISGIINSTCYRNRNLKSGYLFNLKLIHKFCGVILSFGSSILLISGSWLLFQNL